jgi:hypothetical protein
MTRLTPPLMMGVGISCLLYIYGNNMLVIHNTQRPESMLKMKSNSIYYHNEGIPQRAHRNERKCRQYCYESSVWAEAAILGIATLIQHL